MLTYGSSVSEVITAPYDRVIESPASSVLNVHVGSDQPNGIGEFNSVQLGSSSIVHQISDNHVGRASTTSTSTHIMVVQLLYKVSSYVT